MIRQGDVATLKQAQQYVDRLISPEGKALSDGGLHRLELRHRMSNPASAAVARAAGFVREGIEREKLLVDGARIDVCTYGRLRSDEWPTIEPLPITS